MYGATTRTGEWDVVIQSSRIRNRKTKGPFRAPLKRSGRECFVVVASSSSSSDGDRKEDVVVDPVVIDFGDGLNDENNAFGGGDRKFKDGGGRGGRGNNNNNNEGGDDFDDEFDEKTSSFNKIFKFLVVVLLLRYVVKSALRKLHAPVISSKNVVDSDKDDDCDEEKSIVENKNNSKRVTIRKKGKAQKSACAVVIPALNEEENIEVLLLQLRALRPQASEIVVAVGDSVDDTSKIAERYGAKVVRNTRGRSQQLNAGVATLTSAATKNVLFLHADTIPFPDILRVIDCTLKDTKTILGGFVALLTTPGKTYWSLSYHNIIKSDLYTAMLFPGRYLRGLKLLFGDQGMFCRLEDFKAVRGYDETLPIMEDADLCVRMQKYGFSEKEQSRDSKRLIFRTSCVRLVNRVITTSGRRIESLGGSLKATFVHFLIGGAWGVFKVKGDGLVSLYNRFYLWDDRGNTTNK